MGTLDQVMQLRNQGYDDSQIAESLRQQGVSPREITNALNQAQIKNAVSGEDQMQQQELEIPEYQEGYDQNYYSPQEQVPELPTQYPQQQAQQNYGGYDQYAQQDSGYYPQENYNYGPGMDANNMIEIAEQVFSEKISKINKQLEEINEFKVLTQSKVENLNDRLRRIETTIDKLQISILDKIGSYGDNLESIKKEMEMIEDSFSKVTGKKVAKKKISKKK